MYRLTLHIFEFLKTHIVPMALVLNIIYFYEYLTPTESNRKHDNPDEDDDINIEYLLNFILYLIISKNI